MVFKMLIKHSSSVRVQTSDVVLFDKLLFSQWNLNFTAGFDTGLLWLDHFLRNHTRIELFGFRVCYIPWVLVVVSAFYALWYIRPNYQFCRQPKYQFVHVEDCWCCLWTNTCFLFRSINPSWLCDLSTAGQSYLTPNQFQLKSSLTFRTYQLTC